MPIAVSCPECGKAYQLPEESLGRKATCKSCGNAFRVQTGADAPQSSRSVAEAVSGSKSRISSSDTLPAQIGRFQILDKLGTGAFGTVYKAYDPVLEREVAVKVPNPGLLSSERDKQRYLREPKAAGQLHHPNIVPVFEASLDGDNIFIVSAFINGRTLEKAIEEKRPDLRRAATLVMKLARALQYAHENGIVHRDVKPANIMLDAKGEPLLMDFGLARIQESAEKLTMNEAVLGTPAYMSPEQASHNNENVGPASDQYSLGVILFEMLCGQRPFSGTASIVMSLVIKQEPPAPRSLNPKLPRDLETICLKAMSKEPKKRFADCQELADDLERWLQDEPITARRTTFVERGLRWCRRNPLVAGLTGSVGLLLFLVAIISSFATIRLDNEKRRADEKADEANKQMRRADAQAVEARQQIEGARREREAARRERDRTKEQSRRAIRNYYFAQMNLARDDWENADIGRLNHRLGQTRPENTGAVDLRQFEWYYWAKRCQGELFPLAIPKESVGAASFSPNGARIVTCGTSITIWDASKGTQLKTLSENNPVGKSFSTYVVAYNVDGTLIATCKSPSAMQTLANINVWNTITGARLATIKPTTRVVTSVGFSPDSRRLIVGSSYHDSIIVWDIATAEPVYTLFDWPKHFSGRGVEALYSHDGNRIFATFAGILRLWDARDGKHIFDVSPADKDVRLSNGISVS